MKAITEAEFRTEVLLSPVTAIVMFGSESCHPCKQIKPLVEKFSVQNDGRVRVFYMDVDYSPKVANTYRVRAIPTLIAFSGLNVLCAHVGTHRSSLFDFLSGYGAVTP